MMMFSEIPMLNSVAKAENNETRGAQHKRQRLADEWRGTC